MLYAGNPENPVVLVHVVGVSYAGGMSSENPSGADNQQERPISRAWLDEVPTDLGNWVAGFVDGEGSFNVPIRRERDRRMPWRVGLSFNVSQRGEQAARLLRDVFSVGTIRPRSDGVVYFEITSPKELRSHAIPFFERFPLRGEKRRDLELFETVVALVESGEHLNPDGVRRVMAIRNRMNRGGKRHRTDNEIETVLEKWESSEAIRKAPCEVQG